MQVKLRTSYIPNELLYQLNYNPSPIIFKHLFHVEIHVVKIFFLLQFFVRFTIPYVPNQPINQQDIYRQQTLSVFIYDDSHDFNFACVY